MSNCEHKWTRTGFVLASYPPQFPYKCEKCGITKNFRQGEEPMLDACKKCGESKDEMIEKPKITPEMLKLIKDSLYMNLEYQKKFLENHKHKEMANHYMHQHIEDLKEVIKILEGKE